MVVTSGQFLIDSEARMREALARMIRSGAEPPTPAAPPAAPAVTLPAVAATALGAALDAYLAVGDALAADTSRDIGVAARAIADAMPAITAAPVENQPHFWHVHPLPSTVADSALALSTAPTLDEARRAYVPLSNALIALLRLVGVPPSFSKKLEILHCPMYPDGSSGSEWIQRGGLVRNPYFGKVMLTCSDRREPLSSQASSP
jgi:hypothetical protein